GAGRLRDGGPRLAVGLGRRGGRVARVLVQNLFILHVAILNDGYSRQLRLRGSAGRSGWCRAAGRAAPPAGGACESGPIPASGPRCPPPPPARRGAGQRRASGPRTPAPPPRPRPSPGAAGPAAAPSRGP